MRIIGGEWGGRKIHPPSKMPYTRPNTDIVKEGLFNIIQSNRDLEGLKTLDLFGVTGSISFELASRGAADLTIVEKDSQMLAFIRKTAESLGLTQLKVVPSDVFRFLKNTKEQYDFIFAGPPYALETIDQIPVFVVGGNLLKTNGWFGLGTTAKKRYKWYPPFVSDRDTAKSLCSNFLNKA